MPLSNTGIDRFLSQNYYSKTQLNAGQLDSRYFAESEFIATSAGAGDAGKPIKLNGSGALDATLYASSVVTLTGTQTLTNKTLTDPVITKIVGQGGSTLELRANDTVGAGSVWIRNDATNTVFSSKVGDIYYGLNGTATMSHIFYRNTTLLATIDITGLAVTGVITAGGVAVPTISSISTLTNKTLTAPIISTISNTGTLTLPTATDTLVGRATTDTLVNKTMTAPIISTISNTGTLTLPTSTDTLVGRATTDTLVNKTMTSPTINSATLTTPTISSTGFTNAQHAHTGATSGGQIDHGAALTGLSDDDHAQYALLAGRSLGQTLNGGNGANEDIVINGTAHATKTSSLVIVQPTGGAVVVGGTTTDHQFEIQDQGASNYRLTVNLDVSGVNYLNSYSTAPSTLTAAPLTIVSSALGTTGDTFRIETTKTPTGAGAGSAGQIAWDTGFIYVCTAANTWKRAALSAF
jgi:hypothetical protein